MKKFQLLPLLILSLALVMSCGAKKEEQKREKLAIAGSYAPNIIIIDKATGDVEWNYDLPYAPGQGGECNSVYVTEQGDVLFSYKKGAMLVKRDSTVVWDFPRDQDNQEVQSVIPTTDGFLVAICGTPSKFVFLDKNGKKVSETTYDTGLTDAHSQFRQVRLAENGNILIPVMGKGTLLEIDKAGNKVNEFPVVGSPFTLEVASPETVLVSGESGIILYNTTTGAALDTLATTEIAGEKLAFPTQFILKENGNIMLSNWQGHVEETSTQIIEVAPAENKVVWSFSKPEVIKYVSAIYEFAE